MEVIEKSVRVIETIKDEALRGDSLAAMSIMATGRYSSKLIQKYVRREMLMNSPLFEEWVSEEREEAERETSKKRIIERLELKFEVISKDTKEYINSIQDDSLINTLFAKSIKVVKIEDFEEKKKLIPQ